MFFLLEKISLFLWTPLMLVLLMGSSVILTFKFDFLQFIKVKSIFNNTIKTLFANNKKSKSSQKKDAGNTGEKKISPFAAMSAALAGTMGVGNIAGVATAITAGGAGAIFWMWVSACFCMILKFVEVTLAQLYKVKSDNDNSYVGGPMYYLKNGVNSKLLAILFSFFCILSSFGIGNMTQSNTVSQAVESTFGIKKIVVGIVISAVVSFIIIGGVKRIVSFTSFCIPLMSAFYMIFAVVVLVCRRENIIDSFCLIFSSAFSLKKVGAGIMGYTISNGIRFGISRGIFSNEAGLGSAPIVHAAAENDSPVKQGMWGIFEVFFDTIVVCTITALVILTTNAQNVIGTDGLKLDGIELTNEAFSQVLGFGSDVFLTVSIIFFAVATIICWSYYGECCVKFLVGPNLKITQNAVLIYKILFIFCIIVGTVSNLNTVWLLSDIFNALMAVPNLMAVVILYKEVLKELKKFKF